MILAYVNSYSHSDSHLTNVLLSLVAWNCLDDVRHHRDKAILSLLHKHQ